MMFNQGSYMHKTIVITGASSGIGNALAHWLANAGHHIIAVGRNEQALQALHQLHPDHVEIIVADITSYQDRQKIADILPTDQEGICLVHNAGISQPNLIANLTEEEWDQHDLVNTKAPLFLTKLLLPHLKNGGRVLHVSTGLAHRALAGFATYGMTKAAFYMLKEYCNIEFEKQDIIFGSAMPGVVDTPIQAQLRSHDNKSFPSVDIFKGFQQRGELLSSTTAAKFLAWLLIDSEREQFVKGDWDIYDTTHHQYWADAGEVKLRS